MGPTTSVSISFRLLTNNLVLKTFFVTASVMADPAAGENGVVFTIKYNVLAVIVHAILSKDCPRNMDFTVLVVGTFIPLVGHTAEVGPFKRWCTEGIGVVVTFNFNLYSVQDSSCLYQWRSGTIAQENYRNGKVVIYAPDFTTVW